MARDRTHAFRTTCGMGQHGTDARPLPTLSTFTAQSLAVLRSAHMAREAVRQQGKSFVDAKLSGRSPDQVDAMDQDVRRLLTSCLANLDDLKATHAVDARVSQQVRQHRSAALQYVYQQLEEAAASFAKLRKLRMERAMHVMQCELGAIGVSTRGPVPGGSAPTMWHDAEMEALFGDDLMASEQEQAQLQLENEQLLHRFEYTLDQAQAIQRQLAEISELQREFSTRVMQQHEQIMSIHDVVVKSVDFVDQGNDQLRQASSRSVDFRMFVLLFLVIMSGTLLFLHWYQ